MNEPGVNHDALKAGQRSARRRRAALGVLGGAMLALLVYRGVLPGLAFGGDFTMIHAGAKLWWEGGNPYDFEALYAAYEQAGGQGERPKEVRWFVALYPPTTYAVLGPLGALSWPAARAVWLGLSLLSAGAIAKWAWAWRPGRDESSELGPLAFWGSAFLLGCLWLGFAPVHTTLRFGQLGLVVLALLVWAVGVPRKAPAPWVAGALLALAGAIKPQLAGVVALGLLGLGRWRDLVWTLGIGLVFAALAVARLEQAAPSWFDDLLLNLERFAGKDFADPRPSNPVAYQMLQLDPLAWRLAQWGGWLRPATWGAFALSGVWAAWRIGKARCRRCGVDERSDPGEVTLWLSAVLAVLTLLVAYHRFYDAVLLVVPAVWAWRWWAARGGSQPQAHAPRPARWPVVVTAALILVFMLPGAALLAQLAKHGTIPPEVTALPGWHAGVMHHGTWALLGLWVTLLWAGPAPQPPAACRDEAPRSTAGPA